jgi:glycosyltransferase involved in cell wall biosynthesis
VPVREKPVRILFYAGGFVPLGGIESFIHALSQALARLGHQVELLCWGPGGRLIREIAESGAFVHRQPFRWGCRLAAPDAMLAIRHGARVARPDIVIFTKLPPLAIMRRLRRLGGSRRFVYVTAYRPAEMWPERPPSPALLASFDAIIVQTPGFRNELRAFGYQGPIEVIPLVPPRLSPVCALPPPDGPLRLGFLGRLVPQKNLPYLLDSFALLSDIPGRRRAGPPWELHLYGDGAQRTALEAAAAAGALRDRIHFHGPIAHDRVPAAIDGCHLFAFSSVSEGQCLAALEILARGRPIVATPVGAFPEILGATELGRLAPLGDAKAFSMGLMAVGADLLSGALSPEAVQARFRNIFSYERVIGRYESLFTALARPAAGAG